MEKSYSISYSLARTSSYTTTSWNCSASKSSLLYLPGWFILYLFIFFFVLVLGYKSAHTKTAGESKYKCAMCKRKQKRNKAFFFPNENDQKRFFFFFGNKYIFFPGGKSAAAFCHVLLVIYQTWGLVVVVVTDRKNV